MKLYKDYPLNKYVGAIAQRQPVPGGGSAAALTAALGVSLVMMVAQYSRGKTGSPSKERRLKTIIQKCRRIQKRLMDLVDLDAISYLNVVKAREMKSGSLRRARQQARKVPQEVCRLSFQTVAMMSFLVKSGNLNLISDVEVALELLSAAFRSARILAAVNQ